MLDFLKRFGLGIVYVLIAPFVVAFLLGWTIYGVGIFFVGIVHGIKSFFAGKKFFEEFPEDLEAKKILSLDPYNSNVDTNNYEEQLNVVPFNQNENGELNQ